MNQVLENFLEFILIGAALAIALRSFAKAGKLKKDPDADFELYYPKGFIIFCLVGLLFFLVFFIVNIGNVYADWGIGTGSDMVTIILFGCFTVFYLVVTVWSMLWRIKVKDEQILYRNGIGIRKKYGFIEIGKIVRRLSLRDQYTYFIYGKDGRKLLTIDESFSYGGAWFWEKLQEYNIPQETKKTWFKERRDSKYAGMTKQQIEEKKRKQEKKEDRFVLIFTIVFFAVLLLLKLLHG